MWQETHTRRRFVGLSLGAAVAAALPLARTAPAGAALQPLLPDATLQAFYDTIIPGRRVARTVLGAQIHPKAIAGVDPDPGAVEADALALGQDPHIGFSALAPAFLADLETRALGRGGPFLTLGHARRVQVCVAGLAFSNPLRILWEAACAVPYTAFCGAGLAAAQTPAAAPGYRVMGHGGAAPAGYPDASYRQILSAELTTSGNLP